MNLEDVENFNFLSVEQELKSYNNYFKNFDVYSLNKDNLEKYIKKFRELISKINLSGSKFKFKTIDYMFFGYFVGLIILYITTKQVFLLPFLGYDIYVLVCEYSLPFKKWLKNKDNKRIVDMGLENISKLSRALDMYKGEVLDVILNKENNQSISLNINDVIEQVEDRFKFLTDEICMIYYKRYTSSLAKFYSEKSHEGEKELIDLLIELNDIINDSNNEKLITNEYIKTRSLNNK